MFRFMIKPEITTCGTASKENVVENLEFSDLFSSSELDQRVERKKATTSHPPAPPLSLALIKILAGGTREWGEERTTSRRVERKKATTSYPSPSNPPPWL